METDQRLKLRYFANSFIAVMIILAFITIFYYKNLEANRLFVHSKDVQFSIQNVLNSFQDAEIGQRGYIITQEEAYLLPYNEAEPSFKRTLKITRNLLEDNPKQLMRLDTIQEFGSLKFEELRKTIDLIKIGDVKGAIGIVREDLGKSYMDEIRRIANEMTIEENQLLNERRDYLLLWRNLVLIVIFFSLLIFGFSLYFFYKKINPLFDELSKTKIQLKNLNDNLSESLYNMKKEDHDKQLEIKAMDNIALGNKKRNFELDARNQEMQILTDELLEIQTSYQTDLLPVAADQLQAIHKVLAKMKVAINDFKEDLNQNQP